MFKNRFSYFCRWTTLHGFPFFFYPHKPRFHNSFWSLIILTSTMGALFVVFSNISDFAKSTVSYDLATPTHSLHGVYFPSIVLCNMNKLRASFIHGLLDELGLEDTSYFEFHDLIRRVFIEGQDTDISKADSKLIEDMLNTTFYQSLLDEFYSDRDSSVNMTESNTNMFVFGMAKRDKERGMHGRRRFMNVGNQFRDGETLLRVDFAGFGLLMTIGEFPTDLSDSCFWITPFVKEPDEVNFKSVKAFAKNGINNGLHFILDAETYDYAFPIKSKEGFTFTPLHHLDVAIVKQAGNVIMPGHATQVAITPTVTKTEPSTKLRFKPHDRQCYFDDEISLAHMHKDLFRYDMFNCLYEASLQKIEEVCLCSPTIWVRNQLPPCEGQKKHCMTEIMEDIGAARHVNDDGEAKECLVACHDQTHQLLTTSAAYPNQESFHLGEDYCLVLNKLRRSCKTEQRTTLNIKYPELCVMIDGTLTLTCEATRNNSSSPILSTLYKTIALYARENLSVLDIYIKDPYVKLYMRREKITVISFIGNIGGLLGLFIGFSFISAVEIIYVFFLSSSRGTIDLDANNKMIKRGRNSRSNADLPQVECMAS